MRTSNKSCRSLVMNHEPFKANKGKFLLVFMTARLVLSMPWSDIPLYEAGQTSAPVCLSTYDCEVINAK